MARILTWLGAQGTVVLAGCIFIGLALPGLADFVRPAFPVAVFSLLAIAMIRADVSAARAQLRRPLTGLAALIMMMAVTPLAIAAGFQVFEPTPAIALAMVFWATAPTTVSSPAMCYLLGLDGTFSLALLLAAMIAAPFVVPALTELLTDTELAVSTGALAVRLAILIGGAALVAYFVRRALGPERRGTAAPVFDGLNMVFMILFAVASMDGVTHAFIADPLFVLGLIALTFGLNVGFLALSTALFWWSGRRIASTIGFSNGNRNMALVLGALAGNVPDHTWLFFAVAQFPIYITPLLLKPVYVRLLNLPGR
ncbi:MAG: sodium:proton symporter [Hyphomicrobiales bacterium]